MRKLWTAAFPAVSLNYAHTFSRNRSSLLSGDCEIQRGTCLTARRSGVAVSWAAGSLRINAAEICDVPVHPTCRWERQVKKQATDNTAGQTLS